MSSSITDRLLNIRTQIHTNVSQVYTNELQCQRLSSRIDQLTDPLERLEHASSLLVRQETRLLLDDLLQCIDDCNSFIEKLTSPTECPQEVYDHEKFEELNKRLSQLGQDLCLGVNIQEIFSRKQDQEDQRRDLQDLTQKINQISQQQQEQHKLIDKTIQKRFESFLYHLEQNSNQTKVSFEKFLHIPYKDLYIKDKPIGSGSFADVYKGVWLTHHDQVAVKVLRINHLSNNSQSEIRDDFYQEISTMYQIRYEHVVTVLGACIELNFYAIIVEYMPLGSLSDVLQGKSNQDQIITLSWSDRYSLAWQMAKSINYLHNLNPCIIHRDIKSMNFLMKLGATPRHRFLLKVCDFGLAEIRRESLLKITTSCQAVGSLAWKAPELLTSHGKYTKQSDVYSLGVTMWELATGKKPWNDYTDETVIVALVKIEERPNIPDDIPEEYKQAVEDAWNQNPHKRPTCFDLMEIMCKQMKKIKEKDELIINAIDLHCQQITTTECILATNTDSTRISILVEEEEENSLTDGLSNIIISNHQPNEEEFKTSTSSLTNKQIMSENIPTVRRLERSLSKFVEDLSAESVLLINSTIRPSHPSKSTTNLHRSIIGKTFTPSNDKDQDNHTPRNRHQSIIKQDTDSLPLVYRF